MTSFVFERWDDERIVVNRVFAKTLADAGLTTFDSLMRLPDLGIVRSQDRRETAPLRIDGRDGPPTFFIKRHGRPPIKEYVKPILRLTMPTLGARIEWDALLKFHEIGIPTMMPVALGESRGESFLVTQALKGFQQLDHWLDEHMASISDVELRETIAVVARLTQAMHGAGVHHQDCYLCHFLVPAAAGPSGIHVIDLGRAHIRPPLAKRWIVKDLAQLDYSAQLLSPRERLRFLRQYLRRGFEPADRQLVRQIAQESRHCRPLGQASFVVAAGRTRCFMLWP